MNGRALAIDEQASLARTLARLLESHPNLAATCATVAEVSRTPKQRLLCAEISKALGSGASLTQANRRFGESLHESLIHCLFTHRPNEETADALRFFADVAPTLRNTERNRTLLAWLTSEFKLQESERTLNPALNTLLGVVALGFTVGGAWVFFIREFAETVPPDMLLMEHIAKAVFVLIILFQGWRTFSSVPYAIGLDALGPHGPGKGWLRQLGRSLSHFYRPEREYRILRPYARQFFARLCLDLRSGSTLVEHLWHASEKAKTGLERTWARYLREKITEGEALHDVLRKMPGLAPVAPFATARDEEELADNLWAWVQEPAPVAPESDGRRTLVLYLVLIFSIAVFVWIFSGIALPEEGLEWTL